MMMMIESELYCVQLEQSKQFIGWAAPLGCRMRMEARKKKRETIRSFFFASWLVGFFMVTN